MRKSIFLLLLACTTVGYAQQLNTQNVRSAIEQHIGTYPEAQLKDLYKAFFQAEFGAEHIVADTLASGKYLDSELTTPDNGKVYYEPIGADSTFFRVHLKAVQQGLITRDQLFHAFLAGVHKVEIPQISRWKNMWRQIEKTITGMKLNLPEMEKQKREIQALLNSGEYASHHSDAFQKAYDPHYRIVRKDAFYKELFPFLKDVATAADFTPQLEFAFEIRAVCEEGYQVGETPMGVRNIIPIIGGKVAGPMVHGDVLPGGADYQLIEKETGRTQLEAIYSIRTHDGVTIHVRNVGILNNGTEGFYFKTAPKFEAPKGSAYEWLNNHLFICVPGSGDGYISLKMYVVK